MNIQKILNGLHIIKNYQEIVDIYRLEKCIKFNNNYIKNSKYKSMIIYKSKLVSNVELSLELIYKIFFNGKNVKNFDNKIIINIIFELIKCSYKIKELKLLKNIGIPFYVDENIFYTNFLGIDKNKYINNIINNTNDEINNIILPYQGNLFLPIKSQIKNKKYKNKFIDELISNNNNINYIISNKNYIGEILYLIRPVIYISLLLIFKDNKIIPLIVNIVIDVVIFLSRMDINKDNYKKYKINFLTQKIHFLEMKFRNKNFFIYIFREPIFSNTTIPLLQKIFNILHLPNFITNFILNILDNFSAYSYIA